MRGSLPAAEAPTPTRETVAHILDLGGWWPPEGPQDSKIARHAAHGGRLGPADATAFAGAFRGVLDQFAFHLRLATGHRPGDADRRAAARRMMPLFRRGVPEMLDFLDSWVRLLR